MRTQLGLVNGEHAQADLGHGLRVALGQLPVVPSRPRRTVIGIDKRVLRDQTPAS